jgi:hypothetical protein
LQTAAAQGRLSPADVADTPIADGLRDDLERLTSVIDAAVPPSTVLAFLLGWTQMFGLIGFELTHQTRNVVEHHAELFATCSRATGTMVGLR